MLIICKKRNRSSCKDKNCVFRHPVEYEHVWERYHLFSLTYFWKTLSREYTVRWWIRLTPEVLTETTTRLDIINCKGLFVEYKKGV